MSNIPQARALLQHMINCAKDGYPLSPEQLVESLEYILPLLHRKTAIRKAEPQSAPMTPELAASIKAFAIRNKDMSFQAIGQRFNVNSGRVTEVLQGEHLE